MTSSSDQQLIRIRRDSKSNGWYFGDKLRDRRLYVDRIIARSTELTGTTATDLQRALRGDAGAGINGPRMWLTLDDEDYYDDEECSIEPISFGLTGNNLSVSFEFTTSVYMAPDRDSAEAQAFIDGDDWYDQDAAATLILRKLLTPFLERNRAVLNTIEADLNYLSPPWRWRAEAIVETRGRSVNDIVVLGRDSIALAEAFGQNGVITRSIAADLVRSGHAGALIGQSEGDWLDVKRQHYDFGTAVGKIKLAQAVAKFANAEQGGVLIIGMLGKKVPGGEVGESPFLNPPVSKVGLV